MPRRAASVVAVIAVVPVVVPAIVAPVHPAIGPIAVILRARDAHVIAALAGTVGAHVLVVLRECRATLVAQREDKGGQVVYRFDIRLPGDGETVFFDV